MPFGTVDTALVAVAAARSAAAAPEGSGEAVAALLPSGDEPPPPHEASSTVAASHANSRDPFGDRLLLFDEAFMMRPPLNLVQRRARTIVKQAALRTPFASLRRDMRQQQ